MSFYQAMQLGACNLKPMIKACEDPELKRRYITALIMKTFLCLLFCMVIVISYTLLFGKENSIVGVVAVLCILTFRFSHLDFHVGQSALVMLLIFTVFAFAPHLASRVAPVPGFCINLVAILTITVLSCHNIALSNQATFVLSYLLLYGYETTSPQGYWARLLAMACTAVVVAGIFYCKQRNKRFEIGLFDLLKDFCCLDFRTRWQLKLALGISSAVLIGEVIALPRSMWIAFSVMSILQPDRSKLEFRSRVRPVYVFIGTLLFGVLYLSTPVSLRGFLGLLGGIGVGFSGGYRWQTVYNCFGGLLAAIPVLGFGGAIVVRVCNNTLGALYSCCFDRCFDRCFDGVLYRLWGRDGLRRGA